jgi:phosphate transport system ATP-binding protein
MSKINVQQLDFYYGPAKALHQISRHHRARNHRLIGPSGCGKSTFLRCLNRMNDTIPDTRAVGQITLDGLDIYAPDFDVTDCAAG